MRRALAFLTILGGAAEPTARTMRWFPLVGAVLGLGVGGAWVGLAHVAAPALAAALVVGADLVATGFLHVDGLADVGDGMIAPMSRERRLAAMADPATGAFGVTLVVAVLLVRYGALAAGRPQALVVAGLWTASRTAMAVVARTLPYARAQGLASGFLGGSTKALAAALGGGGLLALGLVATGGWRGVAALGALALSAALVAVWARRRLGGFTGDVLGALAILGETAGLVVWALR